MIAVIKNIALCFSSMNRLSRAYIRVGNVAIFTLYFLAFFCYLIAGRIGNYDNIFYLMNELLVCGREFVAAIYVPAILIEIAVIAEKCN